jgi:tetratricopeptide (TPR) repeat protein
MKIFFRHITLFTLVFYLGSLQNDTQAQNKEIDSLKIELEHTIVQQRVPVLLAIAEKMSEYDLKASLKYTFEALEQAQLNDNSLELFRSYKALGSFYLAIGEIEESLTYLRRALELNKELTIEEDLCFIYNDLGIIYGRRGELDSALLYHDAAYSWSLENKDSLSQISSLRSIGNIYYKKGDFDKALMRFREGLSLTKYLKGGLEEKSHLLNNLGILYSDWGEYDQALNHYRQALSIMDSLKNHFDVGRIYNNMGNIYWYKESYDSALLYYQKSLDKREQLGDQNGKAYVLNNFGMIYGSMGSFKRSLDYFKQSLYLFEKVNNKGGVVMTTYNTAYVYLEVKDYENARKYLNQGLVIAQDQGYKDYITANLDALKDLYQQTNDWENAYYTLEKFKQANDSIRNQQNMDIIKELEIKYEHEKHKADFSILKNQNVAAKAKRNQYVIIFSGIIIIIILIVLSTYLLISRMKISTSNEFNKLTPALLRYQMNPEFINSSLSGIKELISKNRAKESGLFLSGFAKLMRIFIETSGLTAIILEKEIDTVQQFIRLHQLRYEQEIDFQLHIEDHIETDMLAIPPLLVFPVLVHIIDYHLNNGKIKVKLHVDLKGSQLGFYYVVEYKTQKNRRKTDQNDLKQSIVLIKDRVKSINKSYKDEVVFKHKSTNLDDNAILELQVFFPVKPI